ncbi:ankyrin repeat-containing domain protein [Aspergillus multicolor]|uniref:ankyrin repeat-containing domain protein n=1 Tax=Aspergillus multicolor TaxID=41759 RepID=UPI003CCD40C0
MFNIELLLALGLDINQRNNNGETPLVVSPKCETPLHGITHATEDPDKVVESVGDLPFVRELVQHERVNADYKVETISCLTAAASIGAVEILELLIPLTPCYDHKDKNGRTAFHIPICQGPNSKRAVRLLLPHTSSLNDPDSFGRTPLSTRWSTTISAALSSIKFRDGPPIHVIKPSILDSADEALAKAIELDKAETVLFMLQYIKPEAKHAHLLVMALLEHEFIALALISWGVPLNGSPGKSRQTPLMKAVENRLTMTVSTLISKGAKLGILSD